MPNINLADLLEELNMCRRMLEIGNKTDTIKQITDIIFKIENEIKKEKKNKNLKPFLGYIHGQLGHFYLINNNYEYAYKHLFIARKLRPNYLMYYSLISTISKKKKDYHIYAYNALIGIVRIYGTVKNKENEKFMSYFNDYN